MRNRALAAAVLLGLALRAWPLHVFYLNPDQGNVPHLAIASLLAGDWRPGRLEYPSGLLYLLRAVYTVAYGLGRALGLFQDRIDVVADWVEDPFPFLLVARSFACASGVATVLLTGRLGARLGGPGCGPLAALFLAVSFLHVRDSHYGMGDVPGAAFFTATLLAAEIYRSEGGLARLFGAAALAGVAAAFRYQLAVVVLAVPVAHLLRAEGRTLRGILVLPVAALVAVAAFGALSPYALLDAPRAWRDLLGELGWAYNWMGPRPLPLPTIMGAASGELVCGLAALGVLAALLARVPAAVPVLVVAVALLVPLLRAGRLFARYTIPLLPLVAVFAAHGIQVLARTLPPRIAPVVRVVLVLVAILDPALRSLAVADLLARDDTRHEAGGWLRARVGAGDTLFLPLPRAYANPVLPPPAQLLVQGYGPAVAAELARRRRGGQPLPYRVAYYGLAPDPEPLLRDGGWVVTYDHPYLPGWGGTAPRVLAIVRERGEPVARFVGVLPGGRALYEPIDANFVPMRGFGLVSRPGPNITVWRLRATPPAADAAAPRAGSSPH